MIPCPPNSAAHCAEDLLWQGNYRLREGAEFTGFAEQFAHNSYLMSIAVRLDDAVPPGPPLALVYNEPHKPLPRRPMRQPTRARRPDPVTPSWLPTGSLAAPFDFCTHVRRLCIDVVARTPALQHIDASRLLFAATQARTGKAHGLQARVTPLRFHGGHLVRRRRGTVYQIQRYFVDGREILYVIALCLPRFLDLDFDEKLVTIFHELYHISPSFDGDLRRHGGRYSVHSHSQRAYDRHMAALSRAYLAGGPDPALHAFLRLNFAQLQRRHGSVVGVVVPRPRLIPVAAREFSKSAHGASLRAE